jgi:hypothetical protein
MKTGNNSNKGYRCPFCLKRFQSAEQLARHLVYGNCRRPKIKR